MEGFSLLLEVLNFCSSLGVSLQLPAPSRLTWKKPEVFLAQPGESQSFLTSFPVDRKKTSPCLQGTLCSLLNCKALSTI